MNKTGLSAAIVATGLALAACGGGGSSTTTGAAAQTAAGAPSAAAQGQRNPGTSGEVAAITGSTLQVQSTTAQTAVTFSPTTTVTSTVAGAAADVTVGSCVTVRSSSAPTSGSSGPVVATTVAVSPAVDGACTGGFGGFGGFGGARPSGAPAGGFNGAPPSGVPGGGARPSGRVRPSGAPGGFGGTAGLVTAVSADGFTVSSRTPGRGTTSVPSATPVTVTTSSSTTYTKEVAATTKALKVGQCVTARGSADSTGSVAATAIAIRPKTDGTCTRAGFGGGAPGGSTNG